MFAARIKTGIIVCLIVWLVLHFSYIPWVLNSVVVLLSVYTVNELCHALKIRRRSTVLLVGTVASVLMVMLPSTGYRVLLAVVFPVVVVLFALLMYRIGSVETMKQWQEIALLGAVILFFAAMKHIRIRPYGLYELAFCFLICMITDSFAYLFGKRFGRHKLAPRISPAKSVEGSIAGTGMAMVLMLLACVIMQGVGLASIHYRRMTIYLVTASVVGQYGDLCMSAVKRVVGIKDYGELLPGHGGVLDRFDSLLFVLPYTCLFCAFCGELFL